MPAASGGGGQTDRGHSRPGPIAVDDEALLRRTLEHYGHRGMDWPDAYLVALVETRRLDSRLSFDRLDAKLKAQSPRRREP